MPERDTTLKAIRERSWHIADPEISDNTALIAAGQSALDVPLLLDRLGAWVVDEELGETPPMIVTLGDCDIHGTCGDCGVHLGTIKPNESMDLLASAWEKHTMARVHG